MDINVRYHAEYLNEYLDLASVDSTLKEKEDIEYLITEVSWSMGIHERGKLSDFAEWKQPSGVSFGSY